MPLSIIAACFGAFVGVLAVSSPSTLVGIAQALWQSIVHHRPLPSFIVIPRPSSLLSGIVRCMVRAAGAFGAARLVLLAFGLGPLTSFAVLVAALLGGWDLLWLWFARRSHFHHPENVQLQRRQLIVGLVVAAPAIVLFLGT